MTTSLRPSSLPAPRIPYDDLGAGAPMILLHPLGFGPAVLAPLAAALATHHRVVIPHRRGFGDGAASPLPELIEDHHDDLAALIGALDLDRPLIAGVSTGGATLALDFARRHPTLVGATVAHEPVIGPLGGTLHPRMVGRVDRLLARADQPHETSLFISELFGVHTWNALRQDWRVNVERFGSATRCEASLIARVALDESDLTALARRPVLVTVGERSHAPRHDLAATLARHGLATRTVPRAAHLPVLEAPAEFVEVLDDAWAAAAA